MLDNISEQALKAAENALQKVRSSLEHEFSSLDKYTEDTRLLQQDYEKFKELGELQSRLLDLAIVVEKKRGALQKDVFVPAMNRKGFSSLPNEVHARLLESLPRTQALKCMLINHRMKAIIEATPSLWSEISVSDSLHLICEKLRRSKEVPLTIVFVYERGIDAVNQAIALCEKHSRRWNRVVFNHNFRLEDEVHMFHTPDMGHVKVMELEGLDNDEEYQDPDELEQEMENHCKPFHENWLSTCLSVTELTIREDIPQSMDFFPALARLNIIHEMPSVFSLKHLENFIDNRKTLKRLSISINGTKGYLNDFGMMPQESVVIRLPKLKVFRLDYHVISDSKKQKEAQNSALERIFSSLAMPKLQELVLRLNWSLGYVKADMEHEHVPLPSKAILSDWAQSTQLKKVDFALESLYPFHERHWVKGFDDFLPELVKLIPTVKDITCRFPLRNMLKNAEAVTETRHAPSIEHLDLVHHLRTLAGSETFTEGFQIMPDYVPSLSEGLKQLASQCEMQEKNCRGARGPQKQAASNSVLDFVRALEGMSGMHGLSQSVPPEPGSEHLPMSPLIGFFRGYAAHMKEKDSTQVSRWVHGGSNEVYDHRPFEALRELLPDVKLTLLAA